ncbi:2-amino-4-hydroxy-6-hydroxymethyldihydropteridine diphosphokinase [Aliihoeflea aestuarii]|uniref:2-amino-4-hydroxy-6- hydroxymethyldihydropteridine diphosphokinase n=1 Tax=Aliihoeflea aestuarii TaxID=453840 RepID=UPI0020935A92|nr:2-amino-4-hydroxy-6-hydroxymethyldihydropteridine diphosphokinase [Aliihoeflea aestuarii]MCO6390644.1 2-amino-4-hydroxy-6-hydroxymethyldihydropteridine diphosphokinase [Aliihoeflea aestuarii]
MSGRSKTRAYLGLGGNLGDPQAAMAAALRILDARPDLAVMQVSSLYRTPPWGVTAQPDFLNAVAEVETTLSPRQFLDACLDAERRLKRVRDERWGPRAIDLDILTFGDSHIDEEGLSVPHPRISERAFVLVPLLEIAPDLTIDGRPMADTLHALDASGIKRLTVGPDWWLDD